MLAFVLPPSVYINGFISGILVCILFAVFASSGFYEEFEFRSKDSVVLVLLFGVGSMLFFVSPMNYFNLPLLVSGFIVFLMSVWGLVSILSVWDDGFSTGEVEGYDMCYKDVEALLDEDDIDGDTVSKVLAKIAEEKDE